MPLTPEQLEIWKADIAVNTNTTPQYPGVQIKDLTPYTNSDHADAIAKWYNLLTANKFAWHFSRSKIDNRRAVMNTAGSANQLDALTGSKRDSLLWCIDDTVDCKFAAVRASIDDLCGSQNTLKAAIINGFKRLLTNIEAILNVGGIGDFSSPYDGGFEGAVTYTDLQG